MSSTCPHKMANFGLYLRLRSFRELHGGHPSKFQRLSRLGSVTARHSSSWRQPNFAALNRRRRLYSAGRPSRWALAHILVLSPFPLVSDIAIFVLKRDVKLQLTNFSISSVPIIDLRLLNVFVCFKRTNHIS